MRARLAVLFALGCVPFAARAHQQRLSYGDYRVQGADVEVHLRFAALDLAQLTHLDLDGDGRVSQHALDALGPTFASTLLAELHVAADGTSCPVSSHGPLTLDASERPRAPDAMGASDGVTLVAQFHCAAEVKSLQVDVGLLELLPAGHTHLARITLALPDGAQETERVAQAGQSTFVVERAQASHTFARFLKLGLEHIFSGTDHLAFLLALLLLGGRLTALIKIVTSFTLAHSITLALAALGVFAPPPRVVEPLIALSILAVALENLWALRKGPEAAARALDHRWMLTFGFGLVHGFGFASALQETLLSRKELTSALVSFNLGVECGQVTLVAAALPILMQLRKRAWFLKHGPRAISLVVGGLGVYWTIARLVGA
ncbi:MAG: HupE/UreJ family protein [Deltaproteobacteria bacterium]|nr:HupE/UreJ family protein [Deltaproteobacteria bacterium]